MSKLRLILLSALAIINCCASEVRRVTLEHNDGKFTVIQDDKRFPVPSYLVDKQFRGRSSEQIARFAAIHSIRVQQGIDGQHEVQAHLQTRGGLGGGAVVGAFIGKWGVTIGGQLILTGIARGADCFAPGSGVWIDTVVRPALTPYIETLSLKAAIGCGILGGVLSGPV